MPIIRRQKPKGYTVISNYMFTQDVLSLKAVGLFCYMVSRPEGWNFTERGLASQLKDGKASIASALHELRDKKYLQMETRQKDKRGRIIGSAYYLYQIPYDIDRSTLAETVFTGDADRVGEFRIEKVTNFTMLSNYHLLDGLSLKAMGLLSYILNLPDDWQSFSVDFFRSKFNDGRTAITSALKELQEHHYIQISQSRNKNGTLGKSIYTIYEYPYDLYGEDVVGTKMVEQETNNDIPELLTNLPCPENPHTVKQDTGNRTTENQVTEIPAMGKQESGNQPQINIIKPNTPKTNIKAANIKSSSSHLYLQENLALRNEMKMKIKQQINYDAIIQRNDELEERMDNDDISLEEYNRFFVHPRYLSSIINAMTDVYCSDSPEIYVGANKTCSKYRIIENFEMLTLRDIREIIQRLIENKPQNMRAYIQVMLHNYL